MSIHENVTRERLWKNGRGCETCERDAYQGKPACECCYEDFNTDLSALIKAEGYITKEEAYEICDENLKYFSCGCLKYLRKVFLDEKAFEIKGKGGDMNVSSH